MRDLLMRCGDSVMRVASACVMLFVFVMAWAITLYMFLDSIIQLDGTYRTIPFFVIVAAYTVFMFLQIGFMVEHIYAELMERRPPHIHSGSVTMCAHVALLVYMLATLQFTWTHVFLVVCLATAFACCLSVYRSFLSSLLGSSA